MFSVILILMRICKITNIFSLHIIIRGLSVCFSEDYSTDTNSKSTVTNATSSIKVDSSSVGNGYEFSEIVVFCLVWSTVYMFSFLIYWFFEVLIICWGDT